MPSPPPARRDLPCPGHMTEKKYQAYLNYLDGALAETWRDTDGTIYLTYQPIEPEGLPTIYGTPEVPVVIRPGDANYARFLDDLLPYFDYFGREVPDAAHSDTHAEA